MKFPQIGEVFAGRYRVDGALGEGGFATVYAAVDRHGRRVALKVLKPDAGEGYLPETRARFRRETRLVGQLTNPHTVSMYDCGETEQGGLFMVFEQVRGQDLSQFLAERGRVEPDVAVHIVSQLLESLREAHNAGLLHRDIKPENIRIFEYGGDPHVVKLLDFGLARSVDPAHPVITATGMIVGTPRYMSPEQLTNDELTAASDIYSLGLVAFELLCGRSALHGNEFADQFERLSGNFTFRLSSAQFGYGLQQVIGRMTALDLAQRYPSAQAVITALANIDSMDIEPSEPSEAAQDSGEFATKRIVEAGPAYWRWAIAAAFVAGLAAFAIWPSHEAPVENPRVRALPPARAEVKAPPAEEPSPVGAPQEEEDAGHAKVWSGCGKAPPFRGEGTLRESLIAGDSWLVYVPESYQPAKPAPVIVLLHQTEESGALFLEYSGFKSIADEHGLLLLAPSDAGLRAWSRPPVDLNRVHDIVLMTGEQLCTDETRVFLVGQGAGARVAATGACEDWVTGVATNSFRTLVDERLCKKRLPKPHFMLSGLHGRVDPADGGHGDCTSLVKDSIEVSEEKWRTKNACRDKNEVLFAEGESVCLSWSCKAPLVTCRLDGGHGWPGGHLDRCGFNAVTGFPHGFRPQR